MFEAPGSNLQVPFKHVFQTTSGDLDADGLFTMYQSLRDHVGLQDDDPHNFILLKEWMLVIPRSKQRHGSLSANGIAMIGMVWTTSREVVNAWIDYGPMKALEEFGQSQNRISKFSCKAHMQGPKRREEL